MSPRGQGGKKSGMLGPGSTLQCLPLSQMDDEVGVKALAINEFILSMAVCHTCVVESVSGMLQSESPDEDALVAAAGDLGWVFVGRRPGVVIVQKKGKGELEMGGDLKSGGRGVSLGGSGGSSGRESSSGVIGGVEYELLATIPFDSDRKRMSVVLRRISDKKIIVYTKGADNVILDRSIFFNGINATQNAQNEARENLLTHLSLFATQGLRTLVFAKKELSSREYSYFQSAWTVAETAVTGRFELMQTAAAMVEKDLIVLGASAIEDKLQVCYSILFCFISFFVVFFCVVIVFLFSCVTVTIILLYFMQKRTI